MRSVFISVVLVALLQISQALLKPFRAPSFSLVKIQNDGASVTSLEACRRNNKIEKRRRNRDYARKFQSKTGGSRRKVVVEEKRLVVAANEEKFQAQVFKMTTDDDMPAYSGFEFTV